MRREPFVALAIALALTAGATCAESYARLALPYYRVVARILCAGHPWVVTSIEVVPDSKSPGVVVQLTGDVRKRAEDSAVAATVVSRLQVGAAIEIPLVFWTVLIIWPAPSLRQRWLIVAAGLPMWLALEVLSSAAPLIEPMAYASATLAGDSDPLTLWQRWSRFLEGGGRFVLAVAGALVTLALTPQARGKMQTPSQP